MIFFNTSFIPMNPSHFNYKNLHHYIIIYKKRFKNLNRLEAPTRFELVIEVLQTFALPLGYGATQKEL